jgi:hypothetical protein
MNSTTVVARSQTGRSTMLAARIDLSEREALRPARNVRRPSVAKHEPRLSDGLVHPVTVRKAG